MSNRPDGKFNSNLNKFVETAKRSRACSGCHRVIDKGETCFAVRRKDNESLIANFCWRCIRHLQNLHEKEKQDDKRRTS